MLTYRDLVDVYFNTEGSLFRDTLTVMLDEIIGVNPLVDPDYDDQTDILIYVHEVKYFYEYHILRVKSDIDMEMVRYLLAEADSKFVESGGVLEDYSRLKTYLEEGIDEVAVNILPKLLRLLTAPSRLDYILANPPSKIEDEDY